MFQTLIEECKLRNYSSKTIKIYLYYNQKLLQFSKKDPNEITQADIRAYLLNLIAKRTPSSTVNLAHNAVNFYYKEIKGRSFKKIPFQKREEIYKPVLDKDEIKVIIDQIRNPKHKLMVALLYASGVRVSELVKIKVNDLNFERKLLLVRQGKGSKDRYTIISSRIAEDIKTYLWTRKNKSPYLFPSIDDKSHLSTRAVEEILKQANKNAGINKAVTPHRLRHSFATHLMDNKVEDRKIQQLLGHKDIKTTQTYARVLTHHLEDIRSPHDNI